MKKLDKIIIAALIALSFASSGFILSRNIKVKNEYAVITVENKIIKRLSLSNNKKGEIYEFKFGDNTGYVEVKDGEIRMLEMNKKICPDGICSETGWISKGYQSIVCLPNKIIVTFEQNGKSELDGTVY